jgi:phage-related protein
MSNGLRLQVNFYKTESGNEPVREWLRSLPRTEKKIIGEDIKTVQFGWPLGMPLVRKIDTDLWEIRSKLGNRIARVLFTVERNVMVIVHGFIKKSKKIPPNDLQLAKKRLSTLRSSL